MQHTVTTGESLYGIAKTYQISLNALLAANPEYKADPDRIQAGDLLSIPQADTDAAAPSSANTALARDDDFSMPFGQLTFDAEGMEKRGPYFSRVPHVPSATSGFTIGRGYDLKERSLDEIITDLSHAGVPKAIAERFAACRGKAGDRARDCIHAHDLADIEISPAAQKQLFLATYKELEGDVIRICGKQDVVHKYGATDWRGLPGAMRDIAVDLRYRGDYTPTTRERVQPLLVRQDLAGMAELMNDRDYWVDARGVPNDRFERRRRYLV